MFLMDFDNALELQKLLKIQFFFNNKKAEKRVRGKLDASIDNNSLPGDLVYYFINNSDSPQNGLIQCLIFISSTF